MSSATLRQKMLLNRCPCREVLEPMPISGFLDGSIWLYLAHNGAYDEQGRLLKLGCVRITPKETKLVETGFRHELDLISDAISIQQGDFKASLWFSGETLVIESESANEQSFDVAFGIWRDKKRDGILQDMNGTKGSYSPNQIQTNS